MYQALETSLCKLRHPQLSDAPAIFKNYASDPKVTRFMIWPTHEAIEVAEEFLVGAKNRIESGEGWHWSITLPSSDECIGMISAIPASHKAEISYVLARQFWGRGIMTAAAQEVMNWCFHTLGFHRVWATCAVENHASARVLEKIGMQIEGVLRGWHHFPNYSPIPQDCQIFSILKTDL